MRTSLDILKRDLLALLKNPIALLVVGALLVLPGLYAWYCILANWDPYSNTGGMPIAVVNYDKGASNDLAGDVNIGEQVTGKLKDNDSIDWRFYDSEEEALEDTRIGAVYATIVLPEDLSENMVGIFEGASEKPAIYYYPNEKYSAVATKVTDSAAQALVRQINQGFSSTVNEKILESTRKVTEDVERKADQANQSAIDRIRLVRADIDQAIASLDEAVSAIDGWRAAAMETSAALGATAERLPDIRALLQQGSDQLSDFSAKTDEFESGLSASILKSASTISEMSAETVNTLIRATKDLQAVKTRLESLWDVADDDALIEILVLRLEIVEDLCESIVTGVSGRVNEIDNTVQEMTGNVTSATNRIANEVMPYLNAGSYELATSLSLLSGAIGQFEPQVSALQNVLSQTDSALADTMNGVIAAKALLSTISASLRGTATDIGAIGNALQVERLSNLIEADPENVGTFISMPVQMVTEKIYPVSNYGTAVAPFYTNLALWVGCFILVSLMKVEVAGFPGATRRERYFGRWMLFVILSLLQSQVICGVDILLGIDCGNPAAFMLAGAVCSFAYMNLIYALVKTFRNIGKTLCIFLLIMQVPGSSGMYPIEMMPGFFQYIHPALPFTYGIDAMREALSGMYGFAYAIDLALMLLIVPGSLIIGLLLRPAMTNLLLLFDEEMSKTGFFASEEYVEGMESDRVRGMVRALAAHASYADEIEERAWKFNRVYPRLRKAGTIATFIIPFAFLVFMLPFNLAFPLSTDTKLSALIVMLVLLLIAQLVLVTLEYTHRTIVEETRMIGASLLDDFDLGVDADQEAQGQAALSIGDGPVNPVSVGSGERRGGPTRDIFVTDLKLGMQSAVGVVVIMLLVITPAMYAWFNIAASWDPYSATGNLKVAVANEDAGYRGDLIPVTINIGDTIVSQLHGNSSFDWEFVDKDEALEGVKSSKYYAAIEIPSDFSANMLTYIIEDTSYPEVVYYTNEKENPIAPIITQKGADAIQENIRVSFTERIDEVVLSVAYDVLNYVTTPQMTSYVAKMGAHLDDAASDTSSAARELRSLASLLTTVSSIIDATEASVQGMEAAGASVKTAVDDATAGISSATTALDEAVQVVRDLLNGRGIDVEKIRAIVDVALELLETGAGVVPEGIDAAIADVQLHRDKPGTTAEEKAKCDAVIRALEEAKAHADAVPGEVAEARESTDNLITTATADVASVKDYFQSTVAPAVEELRATLSSLATSASGVVGALEGALDGLDENAGSLSGELHELSGGIARAGEKLEGAATDLEDIKARVSEALQSGDLQTIEGIVLGSDPQALAMSLATPVEQVREALYPVSNYGSSMAPFYTVLSLWVGALVMISTMRVHLVEERIEELRQRYGRLRPRHEFFGRYGIFGLVGLLQGALVLLGDLLLLHIQCDNPVLFFLFGLFIDQMFCLIVYTITELFGDVGKALCVILLIMQVAASGGTFPAEMLAQVLFNIVPYLPFYHAMSLLQECVAGVYWPGAMANAAALAVMAGAMLVLGLPLRRPFRKVNVFFEEQLEKTGYM